MSEVVERLERIEKLLITLNAKIDNFLGYEEITEEERNELRKMREEVKRGEFVRFGALT
ncbi:MAG: hypothetical protein J7K48_02420 [Thermococcus sp.]|uniref:Uncharacterized protein n=1 Tax=Thermococcus guaymasensis DSM 11113 TaxID=1432656 RepID=A0A0X1KHQ2_9EURY|nr:hypothetical protein [Thermococcus guaymasensis]AJC70786.1 hypothetical protein X802_00210 [Thermococcus guaymasensis DSM 11113]MCD6523838.1 hypothetical protein [Thermococcus sp.]